MEMDLIVDSPVLDALAWLLPLMLGIILHELGHAWAAYKLGDPTAKEAGRLTLNPLAHVHPVGTVAMPLALLLLKAPIMFGYAKPVPIHFANLRRRRLGMAVVAAAGPAANIIIAFAAVLLLRLEVMVTPEQAPWFFTMLYRAIVLNLALAFFNLIPIFPLDGGRILYSLHPHSAAQPDMHAEVWGVWAILILLMMPVFGGPDLLGPWILEPAYFTLAVMVNISTSNKLLFPIAIVLFFVLALLRLRKAAKKQ